MEDENSEKKQLMNVELGEKDFPGIILLKHLSVLLRLPCYLQQNDQPQIHVFLKKSWIKAIANR